MDTNKKTAKKHAGKRKFHWFRFFTVLLAVCVGMEVVLGTVALVTINTMLADEPKVNLDNFYTQETTLIYDKDGNQIADVGAQLRENITYDEIPEALIDAFLSIEDSRYFTHNGFDIPRFTSSIINTVLHHNMQGGSTFTMQLVKLTYFTDDESGTSSNKDIEYKVQQIDLAEQLEKKSTKKQIFEMYLNKMNFGGVGNIRGVEKASEQYFGKRVSQLNLNECAMLAGVVNSPYYYNPYTYLDHATDRRNDVLYQMLNHGYITEAQYDLAKSVNVEDLLIAPTSTTGAGTQYQAYIDYVIKEAQEVSGQDPLNVSMQIYTAMDPTVQTTMESIEAGQVADVTFADDTMEMGAITENSQTGEIIAIGGGRNYTTGGSMLLNHATDQYKQPGSSVKPFLDYAPTFEYLGWATDHILVDKAITYGNWTYKNANGQYYGRMNLQTALARSLNTPAIQACQSVIDKQGTDWYVDYMKKLGFADSVAKSFDISYSIGGNNFVCTPEQLMAAHATIMNGGNYITPHTITKISFRSGNQSDIEPKYENSSVMSAQAAYMISTLMYGNVYGNIFNYLQILKRDYQTFGKTGTTDWGDSGLEYGIPEGAMKDKWMVAETSKYTTAVWLGWEKATVGGNNYFTTAMDSMNTTGHICSDILDAIETSNGKSADYAQPDGIEKITHISGVFPYVAPTASTPSEYITTGLIKKEFAKLGTYESTVSALSNLSSFSAKQNSDNTVSFSWAAYPDSSKLSAAETSGSTFDGSWLTGPVVYKVRLSQNGQTVAELSSSSETSTQSVTLAENTVTQACGYYGYQNTSDASNEVCMTFTTSGPKKETKSAVITAVNGSSLTVTIDGSAATLDLSNATVTKGGANVAISSLKAGDTLTLTYTDGKVTAVSVN